MIRWDDTLWLLTPSELDQLPDGIELTSISGNKHVKGASQLDDDTRYGHLAYGVADPEHHPQRDLLMQFILEWL